MKVAYQNQAKMIVKGKDLLLIPHFYREGKDKPHYTNISFTDRPVSAANDHNESTALISQTLIYLSLTMKVQPG